VREPAGELLPLGLRARQLGLELLDLGILVLERLPEGVALGARVARLARGLRRRFVGRLRLRRRVRHRRRVLEEGRLAARLAYAPVVGGRGRGRDGLILARVRLSAERADEPLVAVLVDDGLCPLAGEEGAATLCADGLVVVVLAAAEDASEHRYSRVGNAPQGRKNAARGR